MKQVFINSILLTLIGLLLLPYAYVTASLIHQKTHTDFFTLFKSGVQLHYGMSAYFKAFSPTHATINNLSPPFVALLFSGIVTHIPFKTAFFIWNAFSIVCLWFSILIYRQPFQKNATTMLFILLLALTYTPSLYNISFGQIALILSAIMALTWILLEKKRYILAGCCLGLAINLKLFFGFFIFYLLGRRYYKTLISFIGFGLFLALIPAYKHGLQLYIDYHATLQHVYWYTINWNASFYGFVTRLFGGANIKATPFFSLPWISKPLLILNGIIFAYATYRIAQKDHLPSQIPFAFCLTAMLFVSPLGWNYYFPLLLPAFFSLEHYAIHSKHPLLILVLLLLALFLSAIPYPLLHGLVIPAHTLFTWYNLPFYALIIMLSLLAYLGWQYRNTPKPTPLSKRLWATLICVALIPGVIGHGMLLVKTYKNETQLTQ